LFPTVVHCSIAPSPLSRQPSIFFIIAGLQACDHLAPYDHLRARSTLPERDLPPISDPSALSPPLFYASLCPFFSSPPLSPLCFLTSNLLNHTFFLAQAHFTNLPIFSSAFLLPFVAARRRRHPPPPDAASRSGAWPTHAGPHSVSVPSPPLASVRSSVPSPRVQAATPPSSTSPLPQPPRVPPFRAVC